MSLERSFFVLYPSAVSYVEAMLSSIRISGLNTSNWKKKHVYSKDYPDFVAHVYPNLEEKLEKAVRRLYEEKTCVIGIVFGENVFENLLNICGPEEPLTEIAQRGIMHCPKNAAEYEHALPFLKKIFPGELDVPPAPVATELRTSLD